MGSSLRKTIYICPNKLQEILSKKQISISEAANQLLQAF